MELNETLLAVIGIALLISAYVVSRLFGRKPAKRRARVVVVGGAPKAYVAPLKGATDPHGIANAIEELVGRMYDSQRWVSHRERLAALAKSLRKAGADNLPAFGSDLEDIAAEMDASSRWASETAVLHKMAATLCGDAAPSADAQEV